MITAGDIVKIVLCGNYQDTDDVIEGTVLQIKPQTPHMPEDCIQSPGPVFEVKILKFDGDIWDSWIDGRDKIEVL